MYIFIDSAGCILGLTREEIGGTTGWVETSREALTAHTGKTIPEMMDGLMTPDGIPQYKLVGEYAELRTQEEMDADYTARPAPPPTDKERITALEEENAVLLECLLEMSEIVYA